MYYDEFKRRPLNALRDVCGIATGGTNRWFASMLDYEKCIALAEEEGVQCPVIGNMEMLPLSMEDNKQLWDYLDHKKFVTRVQSQLRPLRHPSQLRYAHVDLATETMAGVSICHLVGVELVENLIKPGDAIPFSEYRLIVEFDFILTVVAGQVKPISLEKIQNFIIWLSTQCGFNFGLVTFDQWQCLTADTLINTGRGLLPIRDIKPQDVVQGRQCRERVKSVHQYAERPVIRITTNHGETICGTPDHRIEACRDWKPWKKPIYAWTRLDDLKIGTVLHLRQKQIDLDVKNVPLTRPENVEKLQQRIHFKHWQFPSVLTPELAEFIGLYWGDGCTSLQSGIRLTVHPDDLDDALQVYSRLFGFQPKVHKYKDRYALQLSLTCRLFNRWLEANGFFKLTKKGRSHAQLHVPEKVLCSSQGVKSAFLRGLYSADGYVDKNDGTVILCTAYLGFARQIMTMLRTDFGIPTTLVTCHKVGFGKKAITYDIRLRGPRTNFLELIGFCYQRKTRVLAAHRNRKGRQLVERVAKIEHSKAEVYDLEVTGDQSYIANGFVSHN
jgi:hypothetical protein